LTGLASARSSNPLGIPAIMDYTALGPSVIDHLEADSKAKAIEALTAPSTRSPIEATRVARLLQSGVLSTAAVRRLRLPSVKWYAAR
jgi:hypothetical protein